MGSVILFASLLFFIGCTINLLFKVAELELKLEGRDRIISQLKIQLNLEDYVNRR